MGVRGNPELADAGGPMPLSLSLALSILGLIVVAGGGLIWRYVYRPPAPANSIRAIVPAPATPRVAGNAPAVNSGLKVNVVQIAAEAELADGVHVRNAEDVLVKAGDAYMRVLRHNGEARYVFGFFTLSEAEWEHGYLSQGVRRIVEDEDFAHELAVSDDQLTRLRKLPEAPPAKWPQPDRERFAAMFGAWERSGDPGGGAAAVALVKALSDYATVRRAADQKVMADRIAQIKSILNERQVAKINPIPRWNTGVAARPAPGATTKPSSP